MMMSPPTDEEPLVSSNLCSNTFHELDGAEQKELLKKVTLRLLPFLSLLYLMAVLDRANLSNTQLFLVEQKSVVPVNESLECPGIVDNPNCTVVESGIITDSEYGLAVGIFYVGYLIFEVPSNLMMKKTSAPRWLSRIMVSWGIVTICTMFITDGAGLIICRFVLGLAEAGFFPGVLFYLSLWFSPQERASRIGLFYVTSPLSGLIGGILSYFVLQLDGFLGLTGWQWLFLLEGIPSIILGIVTWFILPDRPHNCTFLNASEKQHLLNTLRPPAPSTVSRLNCSVIFSVFTNWKIILFSLLSLGNNVMGAVVTFFLPSIISQFGFDPLTSNALSSPPFFLGVILLLLVSWNSDRIQERPIHLLLPFFFQMLGWTMVALSFFLFNNLAFQYFSLLITVGLHYTFSPIFWAWLTDELSHLHHTNFNRDQTELEVAVGTAVVASCGTFSQIFVPYMTTSIKDISGGSYVWVFVVLIGFGLFGLFVGVILATLLWKEQRSRLLLSNHHQEEEDEQNLPSVK